MKTHLSGTGSVLLLMLLSGGLSANDAGSLPEVTVTGDKDSALPSRTALVEALSQVPGGTNMIDLEELSSSKATLNDVLAKEPGIVMQEFFGGNDQPRLNIRGSGIQENPVNRGIQLLYDGMPINQPDSSFVIGLLTPEQMRFVSVYRGANAQQYGGSSLGGAINMIPRSGHNSKNFFRLQGGSHDSVSSSIGIGGKQDNWDYYLQAGHSSSDGFRHQNEGERTDITFNVGYKFNENLENRTYFNYVDNYFQIPFTVQKQIAVDHPEAVIGDGFAGTIPAPSTLPGPALAHPVYGWNARGGWDGLFNVNERDPNRESEQLRLANKTYLTVGDSKHEFGIYAELLDDVFTDPLAHNAVDSENIGIHYSAAFSGSYLSDEDQLVISLSANTGEMPVEYWVNNPENGSRLFRFADLDQDASNITLGLQYTGQLSANTQVVVGLQWLENDRDISGSMSTPPSPASFDKVVVNADQDLSFDALNPKIGINYSPTDNIRLFANVSRSMEAPTFNHLVARTVGPLIVPGVTAAPPAVPPFADAEIASGARLKKLKEQTAWTVEVGTQGTWEDLSWQLAYYHSTVEDELITLINGFAVNAETLNYTDDTIHEGIELELSAKLGQGIFLNDDQLSAKLVYNYSDFTFDGGVFDGNQIAGIPEHLGYAELTWSLGDTLSITPNVRWQPSDTYNDHSNSQVQDDYVLVGLTASYNPTDNLRIYTDLKNITDETYQTSYVIRGYSAPNQPTFLPGPDFTFTLGASYTW